MSNLLDIDDRDVEDLIDQLNLFARKAMPFAIRNGVNGVAFAAQDEWRSQMARRLTLRNKFTQRSVRVITAKGLNIDRMQSVTGSDAAYAQRMELGGTIPTRGKFGVPIPTPDARIGKSNKRVVSRPNLKRNIQLRDRVRTGSKKQRNARAIRDAKKSGDKMVFLELENGRSGIFRLTGGRNSLGVRMLWDMSRSRRVVRTPKHPTLGPTLQAIRPAVPAIYAQAILEQLRRNTLLGFR